MGAIRDAFDTTFRDHVVAGVPASGANEPVKAEARSIGGVIENEMELISVVNTSGSVVYDTAANLAADLGHPANTKAEVYADSTPANNGVYRKSGAPGAGAWAKISDLSGVAVTAEVINARGGEATLADQLEADRQRLRIGANLAVGVEAADSITSGTDNVAIGEQALRDIEAGARNVAIGRAAGRANVAGADNVYVGKDAALLHASGSANVAIGSRAMGNVATGGDSNVAIGADALAVYTGDDATAIGKSALITVTGIRNTAIGAFSGSSLTTGEFNTFLGWNAGGGGSGQGANISGSIVIGYNAGATENGQVVLGTSGQDELRMFGGRAALAKNSVRNYFWGPLSGNRTATGGANVGLGYNVLPALTTGGHNVAVGDNAATKHQSGTGNVWIGSAAGKESVACIDVVHIGWEAGEKQVSGVGDVGIGRRALGKALFAANNTCVGDSSGWSLNPQLVDVGNPGLGFSQGYDNCIMGYVAAEYLATGKENVLIGGGVTKNTTARSFSVVIGSQAGLVHSGAGGNNVVSIGHASIYNITTASDIVGVGKSALSSLTTGARNTALGAFCGGRVTTGERNTFVGWFTGSDAAVPATLTNAIGVGYNVQPTKNNQVVIGNAANDEFVLGGVTFTKAQLEALVALVSS